ncbi:unnamed protein product [Parnassius apollo]|uniref:(apollo) hypothetical protein n=1 Tax=Parnassius apollo TaxID=110799 RepID=A0A8S3WJ95_PARAO|nr:unnamed protein product [Parnassius apollo]
MEVGLAIKIRMIENKTLDLYCLKFWVDEEGGFENCNTPKKWRKIANSMGYSQNANTMNFLRSNYEKILLPYEIFEKSKADILKTVKKGETKVEIKTDGDDAKQAFKEVSEESITKPKDESKNYIPHTSIIKTKTGSDIKPDVDSHSIVESEEMKCDRELRRLACYGPGPKMPDLNDEEFDITKSRKRPRYDLDPLAVYVCAICQKDHTDNLLLICNDCSDTYHTFCLKPFLNSVPDGDWRWPCYIAEEKKNSWRIISSVEEDVTVEYGADLHSMDHGSGFPTKSSLNLYPGDQEYVDSGWNLNNLLVLDGSVLRFINADISEGDRLDLETALETQKELVSATEEDGRLRAKIAKQGLKSVQRTAFELLGDDGRLCEASLPPPKWTEPFKAVNKYVICPQMVYMSLGIELKQQEDCLIANIYVPDTNENNLPVVIHVHGGAYQMGYGDLMTEKQFIKENNIIIVNFNYRLSVHGFLCLGTEDVPGNAGMKDQVALFRWVKENIASFGGNPDDVTINGFSAGSSSVDLHLVSPMTKGLFNKVIPKSGASLSVFSVQTNPVKNAWKYTKMLNFTNKNKNIYDLELFYKSTSLNILNSINLLNKPDSTFLFVSCVERKQGEVRFLDDAPINVLKSGRNHKLPLLFGFAEMEGLLRMPVFDTYYSKMNENFADFLSGDFKFSNSEEKEEVAQRVKEFYFGKKPVGKETIFRYIIDYFTDVIIAYGTLKSIQLQVESGNKDIYLYEYSFVDDNVPLVPYTDVRGADHCAHTMAVGDGNFLNAQVDKKDFINMKQLMRKLWYNFIKTG